MLTATHLELSKSIKYFSIIWNKKRNKNFMYLKSLIKLQTNLSFSSNSTAIIVLTFIVDSILVFHSINSFGPLLWILCFVCLLFYNLSKHGYWLYLPKIDFTNADNKRKPLYNIFLYIRSTLGFFYNAFYSNN